MKFNHSWLMVLCVVGMGSVFILPILGIPLGSLGSMLLILLCPLSHVLMMWGVFKRRKNQDSDAALPERIPSPAQRSLPAGESKVQEG
jgi:hypothetical protein